MMNLQEIITLLGTALGLLTPIGGVGIFMYRRQNKRLKNAEAALAEVNVDKAKAETKNENSAILERQIEQLSTLNDKMMSRNKELIQMNAEKEDRHQRDIKDWEERFTNQTTVLRNAQRNEKERADEVIRLTEENGKLRVELEKKRCDDMPCPFRLPPNAYTPPTEGISKEDYATKRKNKKK